ncbi:MAG: hypothetical protein PHH57_05810 [Candidatus Omnitrophica bacterium]|nr:hypothetical protein [Candidatus Omnitrophota bacterium]
MDAEKFPPDMTPVKNIVGGILSIGLIAGYILFAVGFILLAVLLMKGGIWLSAIIYPWLNGISLLTFLLCLFILLPLAIFRRTRAVSGIGLVISSYIFGITLWVYAFLLSYTFWGLIGLLIGLAFFGVGIVPIAMLAAIIHGDWWLLAELFFSVLLAFGSRLFGIFLVNKTESQSYSYGKSRLEPSVSGAIKKFDANGDQINSPKGPNENPSITSSSGQ